MRCRTSPGRQCCCGGGGECTDCPVVPIGFRIVLSNADPVPGLMTRTTGCTWVGATGARTYTVEIVTISGVLTLRVTLDNDGDVTVWEADISAFDPLDCCTDLDGVELDCVSSEEAYCTGSVTVTAYAVCSIAGGCGACLDAVAPSAFAVAFAGVGGLGGGLDCSPMNATFIIPRVSACYWSDCFEVPAALMSNQIECSISKYLGVTTVLVRVWATALNNQCLGGLIQPATFQGDFLDDVDCLTLDTDLPRTKGQLLQCDWSAASCHLTAG